MRKWYFGAALFCFLLVNLLMLAGVEPVTTYFFIFIWWSYILTVDSLLYWRRGTSLISGLKAKFLLLIISSYFFWEFFELVNSQLANWGYAGSPVDPGSGAFAYSPSWKIVFKFLAFGSVLPGVLETHDLLKHFCLGKRLSFLGWEKTARFLKWQRWGKPQFVWRAVGLAMLVAPLCWPKYFFWMIWLAVILLLDPGVEANGGHSLFSELRRGNVRNLYRLLLTGLVCGLLWEGWNYWAGLKWVYDVPFVGDVKLFEMPLVGYLGFPVFAIECYIFWEWLCCQGRKVLSLRNTLQGT